MANNQQPRANGSTSGNGVLDALVSVTEENMIETGEKAPDFCLSADDGSDFSLKDLKGMWGVLYFYPKDNTSG